ncbi:MAG TPA: sigma factor-like helix-turn-helix DNA-binding protein, partial [Gemmataceae bacterium]|nr:sigma factor-like helix-turn-helix DNA-binding protein [Gemmataceae bacterium]
MIDPLEEISIREAQVILAEELDGLAAVYREPLLLCHYEGATQDQAARQVGCSLNTLKRRLERGRTLLGRRLSRRGVAPGTALALTLCSRTQAPAQLVHQTITAATQFAAGQALPGAAALLAEGVLRTVMLNKLGLYFAMILAVGSVTLAAGFAVTREKPSSLT